MIEFQSLRPPFHFGPGRSMSAYWCRTRRTGEPRTEADVSIRLTAADSPTGVLQCRATREAATNKLLHSANFDLPSAGRWGVNVVVQDECGSAQTNFEVVAGEPLPAWDAIWLWIGYPALPIVLYTFHENPPPPAPLGIVWRALAGMLMHST